MVVRTSTLAAVLLTVFAFIPVPSGQAFAFYKSGDVVFSEDWESGDLGLWDVYMGPGYVNAFSSQNEWRIVDESLEPQVSPNAHSGRYYAYAGFSVGSLTYGPYANTVLESKIIDIRGASHPILSFYAAGASEAGYDRLNVYVFDYVKKDYYKLMELSEDGLDNPLPKYERHEIDLKPYKDSGAIGSGRIMLTFQFLSDSTIQEGQGWNLDDIMVVEK